MTSGMPAAGTILPTRAPAASRSNTPEITDTRANSRRCEGVSRRTDQSTTASSPGRTLPDPSSSRATTSSTPQVAARAAASSIASGRPSRRRQRRCTAAVVPVLTSGRTCTRRSKKSCAAGSCDFSGLTAPGSAKGARGSTCSAVTPSRCRLVARIRTCGQRLITAAQSADVSARRCSQLSSTRSRRVMLRNSTMSSSREGPSPPAPSARATRASTCPGSAVASSTTVAGP